MSFYNLPGACAALMAVCPILSTSRLGAAAAILCIGACCAILWSPLGKENGQFKGAILAVAAGVVGVGLLMGWERLAPRLEDSQVQEGWAERNYLYDLARPMADDNPLFGTGPGTYGAVSQLYRTGIEDDWFMQLHNDWLETRITFGWVGSALLALSLVLVGLRWFVPGGIGAGRRLPMFLWVGLGSCMLQARWDFPFQIYSILFTFLMLCAVLSTLTRWKIR